MGCSIQKPQQIHILPLSTDELGLDGDGIILGVSDVLKPCYGLAFAVCFLERQMNHCMLWRSTVPVPFPRAEHDRVTGPDCLHRTTGGLHSSDARNDVYHLAERMRMPGSASTRLERNAISL